MAMNISAILATLHGCDPGQINDPVFIEHVLDEAVRVSKVTLLHRYVHKFSPQGVTATAVLAESHLALHSWPENGVLFVDVATCVSATATERAFARIRELVTHTSADVRDVSFGDAPVLRVVGARRGAVTKKKVSSR